MYGERITLHDLKEITQGLCRIGIGLQDAKVEFIGKEFVLKDDIKESDYIKFECDKLVSIHIDFYDKQNVIKLELG